LSTKVLGERPKSTYLCGFRHMPAEFRASFRYYVPGISEFPVVGDGSAMGRKR